MKTKPDTHIFCFKIQTNKQILERRFGGVRAIHLVSFDSDVSGNSFKGNYNLQLISAANIRMAIMQMCEIESFPDFWSNEIADQKKRQRHIKNIERTADSSLSLSLLHHEVDPGACVTFHYRNKFMPNYWN